MITLSPRQAGLLAQLDHAIHSDGGTGMLARDGDNAWYLSDTLWIRMPSPHVDMPGVRILPWSHIERTAARRNGARPLRLDKPDAWVEPADPIRLPDPTFAPLRPPRDQGAADTPEPPAFLQDMCGELLAIGNEPGLTHMTVLKGGRHGRPAWLILPRGMLRGLASIVLLSRPIPEDRPLSEWALDAETRRILDHAGILTENTLRRRSVHMLINMGPGRHGGLRIGPAILTRIERACIMHGLRLRPEPLTVDDMRRLCLRADGRPRKGQSTLPHDPVTGLPEGMR